MRIQCVPTDLLQQDGTLAHFRTLTRALLVSLAPRPETRLSTVTWRLRVKKSC